MTTLDESVFIAAPVGKVFSLVTDPDKWQAFVPLAEVAEVSSSQMEPGTTFRWEYRDGAIVERGTGHVNQNVLNAKFSMTLAGEAEMTEAYTFAPVGDGTELSVHLVIGDAGDRGDGDSVKTARNILQRIKAMAETA